MLSLRNQTIVIVSNEPWGQVWFSKHQYAFELSKSNRVLFIDPPRRWRGGSMDLSVRDVLPGLEVVSYRNAVPGTRYLPLFLVNEYLIARQLRALLAQRHPGSIVFWSFDPFRLVFPALFEPKVSIYHRVDDYRAPREHFIRRNVDLRLAVSESIAEGVGGEAHVLPHGLVDHGLSEDEIGAMETRDEALMVGSLSWKTDWLLLRRLAHAHPDCRFRFVGQLREDGMSPGDRDIVAELRRTPNVEFAGAKAYLEMGTDIARAKVCLCAYKQTEAAWRHSSLKIPLYLAFGKPVVSGTLDAYSTLGPELIRFAADHAEFASAFQQAWETASTVENRRTRYRYAAAFFYPRLLSQIEQMIPDPVHRGATAGARK